MQRIPFFQGCYFKARQENLIRDGAVYGYIYMYIRIYMHVYIYNCMYIYIIYIIC